MEKRITEYKLDETVEEQLDKAMLQVLQICQIHKLPLFMSVAVENTQNETRYKNYTFSSTANFVNLTDDKIRKHMLIADNFEAVPPREVFSLDMGEI